MQETKIVPLIIEGYGCEFAVSGLLICSCSYYTIIKKYELFEMESLISKIILNYLTF